MIKEPPHLPKQVHLGLHVRNEYERLISIFNYQTMWKSFTWNYTAVFHILINVLLKKEN